MLYSYNKRFVFLSEEEDFPLPLCHLCIRTRHSARLFSPFSFHVASFCLEITLTRRANNPRQQQPLKEEEEICNKRVSSRRPEIIPEAIPYIIPPDIYNVVYR